MHIIQMMQHFMRVVVREKESELSNHSQFNQNLFEFR